MPCKVLKKVSGTEFFTVNAYHITSIKSGDNIASSSMKKTSPLKVSLLFNWKVSAKEKPNHKKITVGIRPNVLF